MRMMSSSEICKFFEVIEGLDFSMFSLKVFCSSITFLSFSFLNSSYSCSNVCVNILMSSSLSSNSVFNFMISKFFCSSCLQRFVIRISSSWFLSFSVLAPFFCISCRDSFSARNLSISASLLVSNDSSSATLAYICSVNCFCMSSTAFLPNQLYPVLFSPSWWRRSLLLAACKPFARLVPFSSSAVKSLSYIYF